MLLMLRLCLQLSFHTVSQYSYIIYIKMYALVGGACIEGSSITLGIESAAAADAPPT